LSRNADATLSAWDTSLLSTSELNGAKMLGMNANTNAVVSRKMLIPMAKS
jgi:hypothetical protein